MMIDDILRDLDPRTSRKLGYLFAEISAKCMAQAQLGFADEAAKMLRRDQALQVRRLTHHVTVRVLHGQPVEAAVELVAARFGIEPVQLMTWWKLDQGKRAVRVLRNLRIVRFAQRGWSERKLARKFGLDRATINRIVRKELRRPLPALPALPAMEAGHA